MSEFIKQADQTALWRRWQKALEGTADAPDPLLLAAWAEWRPDETAADAVEAWLARHPEALEDLLAARGGLAPVEPSEAALALGMALVTARDPKVVPLRHEAPAWRVAAAWASMAASIAAVSFVGFELGGSVYASVLDGGQTETAFEQTLLDGPHTVFPDLGEESRS